LADIPVPENSTYIVFENIHYENKSGRFVDVIMPDETKSEFKLGRSKQADIVINDISVTRSHAILKYTEEGFYMVDNNSKFGTLSLLNKLELEPGMSATVQFGRTILQLDVQILFPSTIPKPVGGMMSTETDAMEIDHFSLEENNEGPMET
jgi:hypothetical protein